MKKFTFNALCVVLALSVSTYSLFSQTNIKYVKIDGTGDGSSWEQASGDLAETMAYAEPGDQIWVARGTYIPTDSDDRLAYFELIDEVKVFGGFKGTETRVEQRNWQENVTILSGELGKKSLLEDNSYTVVYSKNVSSTTELNGFTITKGAANGLGEKGNMERSGGGWFNEGAGGNSNPTIKNCTFINNIARDGAALYNMANEGVCKPYIINCTFLENKADLDGGAIFNNATKGICNPIIEDCKIVDNEATYGGGILNFAKDGGEASPSISGSSFENNIAYIRGGGLYSSEQGGRCQPTITSSYFTENKATVGREKDSNKSSDMVSSGVLKKM